jgi:hypothetical protein
MAVKEAVTTLFPRCFASSEWVTGAAQVNYRA